MNQPNSSKWDLQRFAQTLNYFDAIPILKNFDWLQHMFGLCPAAQSGDTPITELADTILVAGATGGVGKRVVKELLAKGYKVRSLVRNCNRATEILGDQLGENHDIVEADITIADTLTTGITRNLQAVICCTGTKVQPVEGDTPSREKYYQGLKFYLPEVVDVPEVVEYQGIQNLVHAVARNLVATTEKTIFDFRQPSLNLKDTWGALDDVVMGGASESNLRFSENTALFSGQVSTANSGGFVSVRTRNFDPVIDLSRYAGIQLRVRGDGNRYKFMLRSETKWDGVAYCYSFDTTANTWLDIQIPFTELIPVFRAKTLSNAEPLNTKAICAFQLMLSKFEYDGALNPHFKSGFFQIQVESITAYGGQALPQFVLVSSAGVTRPGNPNLNLDEEPPAVRLNAQLGNILTWKLRGEEVVKNSQIPYTIIRPCALTEEAGGQKLVFEQGDRLKGKVSRNDIAALCVQALQQSQACNITFEVAEGESPCVLGDWQCLFNSIQPDS